MDDKNVASDATGDVGITADDVLPMTRTIQTTEPLTIDERVANIERAMRNYIDNPPKLADAEALAKDVAAVKGIAESAVRQIGALSDSLPDRMNRVEERCATVERNVQSIATERGVALVPTVRDEAHERAQIARSFTCDGCGTGFGDVVRAAATNSDQRACPTCGRAVTVRSATPLAE